jgi:fatty acid desaturase
MFGMNPPGGTIMAGSDRARLAVPKTARQERRKAPVHLVDTAYWFAVVALLIYADVDPWVWGASAIVVVPIYVIELGYLRARLGALRSS